jgi:membrane-bound lytic murein transglycosylase D
MRKRQLCLWANLVFFCLALLVAGAAPAAERYTVKPGDSLHKIAKKHHVSVDSLKEANRLDGNDLRPKQVLIIPGGKSAKKITEKSTAKKKSDPDTAVYIVKKGDTLAGVSERRQACRIGDQEDKRASVIEAQVGTAARHGKTPGQG